MKALTIAALFTFFLALGWAIDTALVAILLNGIGSFDFSFSNLVAFGGIVALAGSGIRNK